MDSFEPNLNHKHHSVVVTDDGDDPNWSSADDVEELLERTMHFVTAARRGYCYLFIDGKLCCLSDVRYMFTLTLPTGEVKTLPLEDSSSTPVFGRFDILV